MSDSVTVRSLRILLAEDERSVRMLWNTVLTEAGHTVVAVADGGAAWTTFQAYELQQPFDVVISDLSMPGMRGDALVLNIKRVNPSTKTVILTGSEGGTPPFTDKVLRKPLLPHKLIQAIQDL